MRISGAAFVPVPETTINPASVSQALKRAARKAAGWDHLTDMERETLDLMAHDMGDILAGSPGRADYWRRVADLASRVSLFQGIPDR